MALNKKSEELLSRVYNMLTTDFEFCLSEKAELCAEQIQQVFRIEANAVKRGKFNWFDYVAKDKLRPIMEGVMHDNGYKVASDGRILVAAKADYEESMEGFRQHKDGSIENDGRYPNWRSVIPAQETVHIEHTIDEEKFYEGVKRLRSKYKSVNGKGLTWGCRWMYKIGEHYFNVRYIDLIIKACKEFGIKNVCVETKASTCRLYVNTGDVQIITMPMLPPEPEEKESGRDEFGIIVGEE